MKIHFLAAILCVPSAVFAAEGGAALFQQYHCDACHAATESSTGPSLAEMAARYRGDKTARSRLEIKVRRGGQGSFGRMPMPPTAGSVSDGEISAMVAWILSQK